jgi:hypothetical protein
MSEAWSKMYIGLHVKCPFFSSDFNETWIFSTNFRKILTHQISRKSAQWEPSSYMRTGRQTDLTKLMVAFRNLTNSPNNLFLGFTHQVFIVPYLVKKFRDIMKPKVYCRVHWGATIHYTCPTFFFLIILSTPNLRPSYQIFVCTCSFVPHRRAFCIFHQSYRPWYNNSVR